MTSTASQLCLRAVVHPWLCDAMGHLTTRNYLAFFDDASYHLLLDTFGYSVGAPEWEGCGWADVRQTIEYRKELMAGDAVEVHGRIEKIGTKSVTCVYEMRDRRSGDVVAILEGTIVFFDTVMRKAKEIPEDMRRHVSR